MLRSLLPKAALTLGIVVLLGLREHGLAVAPAHIHAFGPSAGDAILIATPEGSVLLSAGSDPAILETLGRTLPFFRRDLALAVLSGTSRGETAALTSVLERYAVGTVLLGEDCGDACAALRAAAEERRTAIRTARAGDRFRIGDMTLEVLALDGKKHPVVFRAERGGQAALLIEHLSNRDEERLVRSGRDLRASVLVMRSADTPSDSLVEAVQPTHVLGEGALPFGD